MKKLITSLVLLAGLLLGGHLQAKDSTGISVQLSKYQLELAPKASTYLTAWVTPFDSLTNAQLIASSQDSSVALYDIRSSVVHALKDGFTIITVKTPDGSAQAVCSVTVKSIQEPKIDPIGNRTVIAGQNMGQIVITGTADHYEWFCFNSSIGLASYGVNVIPGFTAINETGATITAQVMVVAMCIEGTDTVPCDTTYFDIIVQAQAGNIPVTGIQLSALSISLTVGGSEKLTATVVPENATNPALSVSSDNPNVAYYNDSTKMVYAVSEGSANITFTALTDSGTISRVCSVYVSQQPSTIPVTGINMGKGSYIIEEGEWIFSGVMVVPHNATNKGIVAISRNPNVASIDDSLMIHAVSAGETRIVFTTVDGAFTDSCSVTVMSKPTTIPVTEIQLSTLSISLTVGGSEKLTATVVPENATNPSLSVSSENPNVAYYNDSTKMVYAVGEGTTLIHFRASADTIESVCTVMVTKTVVLPRVDTVPDKNVKHGDTVPEIIFGGSTVPGTVYKWVNPTQGLGMVALSGVNSIPEFIATNTSGKDQLAVITVTPMALIGEDSVSGTSMTFRILVNTSTDIPVTGISLNKSDLALTVGGTEQLMATVSPSNATNQNVNWGSDNSNIATVDNRGLVSALSEGVAVITVRTADGNRVAACSVRVNAAVIPVTGIQIPKRVLTLTVGHAERVTASVLPANATNKGITRSSQNPNIASIDDSSVVRGINVGTTTLFFTTMDGKFVDSCVVTVIPQAVPSVNPVANQVYNNQQTVSAINFGGSPVSGTYYLWANNNPSIGLAAAGINRIPAFTATNSSQKENVATITVTPLAVVEGDTLTGIPISFTMTVKPQTSSVTGINLSTHKLNMNVNDWRYISANVLPENAVNKAISKISCNTKVASIDDSSMIHALSVGSTYIVFTTADGGYSDSCLVTVTTAPPPVVNVSSISLSPKSLLMTTGNMEYVSYTVFPTNATNQAVSRTSLNPAVATIDESSLVHAVSAGSTYIVFTSMDGKKQDSCLVTVKPNVPNVIYVNKIRVSSRNLSLLVGQNDELFATVFPSNATNKNYTYLSRNPSIASIDDSYGVQANAKGSTYIVFTSEDGHFKDSCLVTVKTDFKADISGLVIHQNQDPVTMGFVSLYLVQNREQYVLSASVNLEENGSYVFPQVPEGDYVIKAMPGKAENALPTYYGNTENWDLASRITIENATPIQGKNITVIDLPALEGNSIITGYVAQEADNKKVLSKAPVSNPSKDAVVLLQENQGGVWTTVAQTRTNEEGYYAFTNVPIGEYRILLDIAGLIMEETRTIDVVEDGVEISGQNYGITEDGISTKEFVDLISISLSEKTLLIEVGGSSTLSVIFNPVNATDKGINWKSSNPAIVSVDQNGNISGIAKGEAYIIVNTLDGELKDSCLVTVGSLSVENTPKKETHLTVYPNPATDYLIIDNGSGRIQSIQLFDTHGQLILKQTNMQDNAVLNISKIAPGAYLLNVDGQRIKLIKK